MITLLHGDHTEASRREYIAIKQAAKPNEIRVLDGRNLDETTLVQSLESHSLFGGETVVFIENIFSKLGKKPTIVKKYGDIIQKSVGADIVLWEEKELGATTVKSLGAKVTIKLFKLPVLIFQFLDGFMPKKAATLLSIYHDLTKTEAPELVYAMLVRRVRQLIQIHDGVMPAGVIPWQISRLTTQAKSFTMDELIDVYKSLRNIETSVKTGETAFSFSEHIEQLICRLHTA